MHSSKKAKAKIEPAGCNCDIVECETIEGYREHYSSGFASSSSSGLIQNKK
jgi:hypothetical protein